MEQLGLTELRAYQRPDGSVIIRVWHPGMEGEGLPCLGYLRLEWSKLVLRVIPQRSRGRVGAILFAALKIWNSPGLRDNPRAIRGRINLLVWQDGRLLGEQELPARSRPWVDQPKGDGPRAGAELLIREARQKEMSRYLG